MSQYSQELKKRIHFIEYWRYDYQLAIYQEIEGNRLPVYIAAATKEPEPDIRIYQIPQERLDACMETIHELAPRFQKIKLGELEPVRCEKCNYCKHTKELKEVINYQDEVE